jgi:hypothetical protein
MTDPTRWIKASKSAGDNACVEMRRVGGGIEVRDSKHGEEGPSLGMSRKCFEVWLTDARGGGLDVLLDHVE